jgi:Domain of unknown function (DUF4157)
MAEAATLQRKPVTAPPPQVRALVPRLAIQRKSAAMPAYLQRSMRVSQAHDPAEREADSTARAVMAQAAPSTISTTGPALQRAATQASPAATAPPAGDSSGVPLPARVRSFMEPRFRADFSGVRIHTGSRAEAMNRAVGARAFATGSHIYFGKGEYQPDTPQGLELIAHELTHTIQQGAALQRKEAGPLVTQSAPVGVQRLGLSDALDYFADHANNIPGFRMFSIVLGVNPVNMRSVDRSAANILRALVEIVPGGALITQALDAHGVFERAGAWIEGQFRSLGVAASSIRLAIDRFLDSLSWSDIFDLGGVWDRAKRILSEPVDRLIAFGRGLVDGIIRFIKDAILMPLARLAANTRGWDLLCAVLGRNPITGEAVPRNAATLVGGFMKFIGQEDVWKRIQETNAIVRVWAWFQGAMAQVTTLVSSFPSRMLAAFQALELADFLLLPRAIGKMLLAMGSFAVDFLSWGANAVWKLLEIVIQVVSPSAWDYIKRTGAALRSILRDPMPFVRNLGRAAKAGFEGFGNRFKTHLMEGVITWLTGELPGVYIPQALTISEVAKLAFSILGLTWANIRGKLVRAIGETPVRVLETTFDIVVTLVRDGPAAAWEKIKEQLTNLKDMVIGGITDFLMELAARGTAKLVSLFVPGLGFVSALVSIYDMVMVFVERIRTIMEVVRNFIDSITAIAAGNITAAATKVENVLKRLLGLSITFLAGFLGLGRVSGRIRDIINRVRQPIDRALDWLVNWIVTTARRLGRAVAQAGLPQDPNERLRLAASHALRIARTLGGRLTAPVVQTAMSAIQTRYGLTSIQTFEAGGEWSVRLAINPTLVQGLGIPSTLSSQALVPTSTDPQIQSYERILVSLSLPIIANEADPDRYRRQMRANIVAAYKTRPLADLNTQVFKSGVIPRSLNRIRGDIFEHWLSENGIMQRQSPVFVHATLYRKRVADGVIGTSTLVDAKVRRPNTKPDPEARRQMTDYGLIISTPLYAVNVSDTVEKGPFLKVRYIFNDQSLPPLWTSALTENVGIGRYEVA